MQKRNIIANKSLPAFLLLFLFSLLMMAGCGGSNIKMPQPLPPAVKEYRHVTLHGGHAGMKDTGVYLQSRDMYSIFASGRIDYTPKAGAGSRYHDVRPELGWPLMVRIGENRRFHPLSGQNGTTIQSYRSGNLYVGYREGEVDAFGKPLNPEYYRDDRGVFHIDIIVWQNPDLIQIRDALADMKKADPASKPIADAFAEAKKYAAYVEATNKTSEEIAKTEKQIADLKKETVEDQKKAAQNISEIKSTPPPKASTEVLSGTEKVARLEERLAKLYETQAQLEAMKKELEEEKQKSSQLAEELEEKEKREQQLLTELAQGTRAAPVIVIASPKDGGTVNTKTVDVSGVVEASQGIEHVAIFINSRPLEERTGRGFHISEKTPARRLEFAEMIPLESGENIINIRAVDTKGIVSEKKIAVKYVEIRKNFWAVVIGINDYPNAPKLKWAVNDARAFYQHLVDFMKIPEDNVILLLNRDANLTQLRSKLGTYLKKRAGREDMVIIFFAGHGATEKDMISPDGDGLEKYLLPFDADPKDLYASALPMREISHIFYRIQSERLIFIADSCYSGTTGGRTIQQSGVRANISDAFLDRISGGKGRIILTASGANEVSAEDDKLQHGIFTYYLLKGLKGPADADKDGLVSVDEAYRYVTAHVPRATGQEQHPVKKGTVEGRLILSIIP
jgi:uncharacterized caspase-like protein